MISYRYKLQYEVSSAPKTQKQRKRGRRRQEGDLHDKRRALEHQIHIWQQAQLAYTPHAATLVAAMTSIDENGLPQVVDAENEPLFPLHLSQLRFAPYQM